MNASRVNLPRYMGGTVLKGTLRKRGRDGWAWVASCYTFMASLGMEVGFQGTDKARSRFAYTWSFTPESQNGSTSLGAIGGGGGCEIGAEHGGLVSPRMAYWMPGTGRAYCIQYACVHYSSSIVPYSFGPVNSNFSQNIKSTFIINELP